jgi:inorganic pyrophosphatase
LEIEPANGDENCVTGVIEMPGNTGSKLECSKKDIKNPVTQDVVINKNTKAHMLRTFKNPPTFNYGFIPRTWSDNELGGDCDPIDLVDLGWRNIKQTLAVSDYLVLGTLGLVD